MVVPLRYCAIYKIKAGPEMALPSAILSYLAVLRSSRRNKPN